MKARVLLVASLCALRAGDRDAAGADQPRVAPRRLQHAQGHRQAAGRAQGADRRGRSRRSPRRRRLGKSGEMRRLIAKGITLLAGRPWTDAPISATRSSCAPTTSSPIRRRPYAVRLEQIYAPSIELQRSLTAHVVLRKRPAAPGAGSSRRSRATVVKDLGTFDGVGRDLRESPFPFELDVHDVADGAYQLAVEVTDARRAARHEHAARSRCARGSTRWSRGSKPTRSARRRRCAPTSSSRSIACGTSIAGASSCARSIRTRISPPPKRSPPP